MATPFFIMKKTTAFCLLSLVAIVSNSQDSTQYSYLQEVVSFLASDSLQGRAAGSNYETIAADYIYDEFKKNKHCKVYRQKFHFSHDSTDYNSQNIIGFINNRSKKTIVISAHYDHLGTGGELSHSKGSNEVHNGADDNASGVALMLNLSQELSINKGEYNYLFLAHSGHELGLHGSKYFIENLKRKYKKIHLFMNFDMMGRLTENKLYYDASFDILDSLNFQSTDQIKFSKSIYDRINTLDSKWFVVKNIPSVTLSTGRHIDYHKVSDDVRFINFNGMIEIKKSLLSWILSYP